MTTEEVYRELEKDMSDVAGWWMKKRQLQVRIAKWTTKLPRTTWFDYSSSRKNRYIVLSIIIGRKYDDSGLTALVALQKMERGYAVYTWKFPWQCMASPHAYHPHVFDRYAERAGIKKTGIELIKHFMERNAYGEVLQGDQFMGSSVRYKGRANMAKCVRDGVLLGEMQGNVFFSHTFITYDMANDLQHEDFERNRGMIKSNEDILRDFRNKERQEYQQARDEAFWILAQNFISSKDRSCN